MLWRTVSPPFPWRHTDEARQLHDAVSSAVGVTASNHQITVLGHNQKKSLGLTFEAFEIHLHTLQDIAPVHRTDDNLWLCTVTERLAENRVPVVLEHVKRSVHYLMLRGDVGHKLTFPLVDSEIFSVRVEEKRDENELYKLLIQKMPIDNDGELVF